MKEFNYTINGTKYTVEIQKQEGNMVELAVNGTSYTVEKEETIEPEPVARPAVTAVAAAAPKKAAAAGSAVKSPLPGVILDITVKVGDTVKTGAKLLTLEAMKMENTIASEYDGKVLEIKVQPGTSVLEGADLIIIG